MCQALNEPVKKSSIIKALNPKWMGITEYAQSSLMDCYKCEISIIKVDNNMAAQLLLFDISTTKDYFY